MANTSATRATQVRSSTRTPDTSRAGAAFDVGAPVAFGPGNPCPEPCVAQRSAPVEGGGASDSAGDADATSDRAFFQVDPQLQAEARYIFASEQNCADWKALEEVLRKYEEHVAGPPPETFCPDPSRRWCWVGQPSAGVAGRRRRSHGFPPPTIPVLTLGFWQRFHSAAEDEPSRSTSPRSFPASTPKTTRRAQNSRAKPRWQLGPAQCTRMARPGAHDGPHSAASHGQYRYSP